jgi:hypothetical protein
MTLRDIWGAGGHIFAVGDGGTIVHHNGTMWSDESAGSGTMEELRGVWGPAADDFWAVGTCGTIRRYDGNTWNTTTVDDTVQFQFNAVWGNAAGEVFIAGEGIFCTPSLQTAGNLHVEGVTLLFTGSEWEQLRTYTFEDLIGLWGSSSRDVWAVGTNGLMLNYSGGPAWSPEIPVAPASALRDVWGVDRNTAFAVGSGGTILRLGL